MLACISSALPHTAPAAVPPAGAGSGGSPGFARLLDGAAQARAQAQSPPNPHTPSTLQDTRQTQARGDPHKADAAPPHAAPGPRAGGKTSAKAAAHGQAAGAPAPVSEGPQTPASDRTRADDAEPAPKDAANDLGALLAQLRATAAPAPQAAAAPDGAAAAASDGSLGTNTNSLAAALVSSASSAPTQAVGDTGEPARPGPAGGTVLHAHPAGAGPAAAAPDTTPGVAASTPLAAHATNTDTLADAHAADAAAATAQAELASRSSQPLATPAAGDSAATPAALALGTAAGPTLASDAAQAMPGEAHLPAAPGSADFAPQLGAQITTFARRGIEHARLHLNPADMGPVMVQIQLDGAAAQIHMSADHPATRQALEQAMPALASALRESGLTLAGGGVFDQPQQAREQGRSDTPQRPAATTPGAETAAGRRDASGSDSRPMLQRRGLVDLVA